MCKFFFHATPSALWAFEDRVTMKTLLASLHSNFLELIFLTVQTGEDYPLSTSRREIFKRFPPESFLDNMKLRNSFRKQFPRELLFLRTCSNSLELHQRISLYETMRDPSAHFSVHLGREQIHDTFLTWGLFIFHRRALSGTLSSLWQNLNSGI